MPTVASLSRLPLLPTGWAGVAVVAVLAYAAKPDDELGFAVVVGTLALVMAIWTSRSRGRAAGAVSLVLGVLCALLFGGYSVADATANDASALVVIGDAIGLLAGVALIAGGIASLRAGARHEVAGNVA